MLTNERRPAGAASEAWRPEPSVPTIADVASYLDGYTAGEHVGRTFGYVDGHRAGYDLGREDGRAEVLAEVEAEHERVFGEYDRRLVRALTSTPDYATRAELRGEPERAARQRAILAVNGVTR